MLSRVRKKTSGASGASGANTVNATPTGPVNTVKATPTARAAARSAPGGTAAAAAQERIEPLPGFKDTPAGERQNVFICKLRLCSNVMVFSSGDGPHPEEDRRDKEIKRLNLLEIMDYINTTKGVFNEETYEEITAMISANLFRGFAPNSSMTNAQYDPEEDEPVLEAAWPHLQYVYEFLLRFVVSNETDPKVVKKFITQDFLVKLLDLFDSDDPRERDYLKTILHRIYGKFMPYRAFIRKAINSIFYRFVYETERHNGIAELLEILGSIINGFALPLKDEHKHFLIKALLPMHKVRTVSMYHQQLSYCVTQFVEKDPNLAVPVLKHILQYWPRTFSAKEVLFLNEVEEILEMVPNGHMNPVWDEVVHGNLFRQIALCVGSPHFQVAERALFLWNNEYIVSLIAGGRSQVLPLVFEALYTNSRSHWNSTVHGLTCNVVKLFMEMDATLFDQCSNKCRDEQADLDAVEATKRKKWQDIETMAEKHPLYPQLKDKLKPTSTLAYAMRRQEEKGLGRFDDIDTVKISEMTMSFQSISLQPTTDALKRKSILPKNAH